MRHINLPFFGVVMLAFAIGLNIAVYIKHRQHQSFMACMHNSVCWDAYMDEILREIDADRRRSAG